MARETPQAAMAIARSRPAFSQRLLGAGRLIESVESIRPALLRYTPTAIYPRDLAIIAEKTPNFD
jgi:hypothetical protein